MMMMMGKREFVTIHLPLEKCDVCHEKHLQFIVHNHLWLKFARNGSRHFRDLCLDCLGRRMGRPVSVEDLKPGITVNFLLMQWWIQNNPKKFYTIMMGGKGNAA